MQDPIQQPPLVAPRDSKSLFGNQSSFRRNNFKSFL